MAFGRNPYLNPRVAAGRGNCATPVPLPVTLGSGQQARFVACGHAWENHSQQFGYCTVSAPAKCACMSYTAPLCNSTEPEPQPTYGFALPAPGPLESPGRMMDRRTSMPKRASRTTPTTTRDPTSTAARRTSTHPMDRTRRPMAHPPSPIPSPLPFQQTPAARLRSRRALHRRPSSHPLHPLPPLRERHLRTRWRGEGPIAGV